MALELLPTGVSVIAGGMDGVLRAYDDSRGASLFPKQYSFYYEAALTIAGGALAFVGSESELTHPFLYGGTWRIGSRLGYWLGTPGGPHFGL
ncbi:MAG TPA: hypothetical protein VMV23_09390 [Candidatus Nanopelagicaceae bacterium]|nr:hypothetical protein [Candidatus Nanopelagicaceae bacterium]